MSQETRDMQKAEYEALIQATEQQHEETLQDMLPESHKQLDEAIRYMTRNGCSYAEALAAVKPGSF